MSDYDVNLGSSLFNFNAYDAFHSLNDEFFVLKIAYDINNYSVNEN